MTFCHRQGSSGLHARLSSNFIHMELLGLSQRSKQFWFLFGPCWVLTNRGISTSLRVPASVSCTSAQASGLGYLSEINVSNQSLT